MANVKSKQTPSVIKKATLRRAIAAAALGNCMEWFDFGVYGYLAVTIGRIFFPSHNPTTELLAAFGGFAVAFVIRPFGGIFFGPLGDRIGRQRVLAITIILMAASTFMIGVLPSYAQIGIWAPILLMLARLVQGFSTGGEYGGAATFMAEYAPDDQRGYLCSWLEFGTLGGFSLGAILVTLVTFGLTPEAMNAWGWRIPFLCAGPLGMIGLYLRLKLEETPDFQGLQEAGEVADSPLREALATEWRQLLKCVGIVILLNVADYTFLTYMPSYLNTALGIGEQRGRVILIGIMLAMMLVITPIGALSDRIGRKPILVASALGFIVLGWPAFWLMSQGSLFLVTLGLAIPGLLLVMLLGTLPATLPAMFSTRTRYGGFAVSYNISTSLFGGTAPLAITWLVVMTGNDYMPAFYLIAAGVIAFIPILALRETARRRLRGSVTAGVVTAE
ncbi:MAG TPA: MFS transporter [Gammaproteobacteria bacterium]|nr:MFS transporter [Gammaproteobacteria bacterium]